MIEKDHGNSGVKGLDLNKLTEMLCIDYPSEVLEGILRILDKRKEENVDFDEFLSAIKTIMIFDNYFEEMEQLFQYLDPAKTGKIKKEDLTSAVKKLTNSKNELRVPSLPELESAY